MSLFVLTTLRSILWSFHALGMLGLDSAAFDFCFVDVRNGLLQVFRIWNFDTCRNVADGLQAAAVHFKRGFQFWGLV